MDITESDRLPTFASLLVRFRKAAELTQEELAESAHLSVHGISDLERGVKRRPWKSTVQMLADALELEPDQRALFEAAANRQRTEGRREPAPPAPPETALPPPGPSFVGSGDTIERVVRLLQQTDTRLVTLVGPAGVGKTRLALEAARHLTGSYPENFRFIALAEAGSALEAVAHALSDAAAGPDGALPAVEAFLGPRPYLLVLDTFEHHMDEAPALLSLLGACPGLKLLVTSREVLRLPGEYPYAVQPLPLPDPAEAAPEVLIHEPAVVLFAERARAARPDFALTPENVRLVAQICARLDGLPLAIELAAARIRHLALQDLLIRLGAEGVGEENGGVGREGGTAFLSTQTRGTEARQQTLVAAFDWSYRLLSAEEQALFRLLAVFVGGATLGAVETVCGPALGGDPLDLLGSLIDKSLVLVRDTGGETRYLMLRTIRDYARRRLAEDAEAEQAARDRHAAYYLTLARQRNPAAPLTEQGRWLDRMDRERGDLEAALSWCLARHQGERVLALATALFPWWDLRGRWKEGSRWLERALAGGADAPVESRAVAFTAAGHLATRLGRMDEAEAAYDRALALFREAGDQKGQGRVLDPLGLVAANRGEYDRAVALLKESLALARAQGDERGMARALNNLGLVHAQQGQHDLAEVLYEQSLVLKRKLGDRLGIAGTYHNLALAMKEQARYDQAAALLQASAGVYRSLGDKQSAAAVLADLAGIERERGNGARARAYAAESAGLFREAGNRAGVALAIDGLAQLAAVEERPQLAAQLFGAAEAAREEAGVALTFADQMTHDRYVALGRSAVEAATWNVSWEQGRSLSPVEALRLGLEDAVPA